MSEIKKILSTDYVKNMFNVLTDGILIADGAGYVLWLNDAVLERIKPLTREEIVGEHVDDLEERNIFNPSITKLVLAKGAAVKEIQSNSFYKNKKRSYVISGYPIQDKGGHIVAIVIHSQYIPEIVESTSQLEDSVAILSRYSQEIRKMQLEDQQKQEKSMFISKDPTYLDLLDKIDKIAITETTTLITGETGVGKSFLAKRIHQLSDRVKGPFVEINCGAIPESLIESELFGYVKAAFTGANPNGKLGLISMANKGTIFLDEIGELPLHLQVKLLQFLQEKRFLPIGATKYETANVRIIAATNRHLPTEVKNGNFRADLYYRLNVLPLHIPPLRERKSDIIPMTQHYLQIYNEKFNRNCRLSNEVADVLQAYDWPGNIREIENLVERLVLIAEEDKIQFTDLPANIQKHSSESVSIHSFIHEKSLTEYLDELEKDFIVQAYKKYRTTRKTAEKLGITQSLLMRRIKKYGIKKAT